MKKVGILFGVLFIVAAIVVFFISSKAGSGEEVNTETQQGTTQTQVGVTQENREDKKNEKNEAPVNNEQQPQQQVTAPQTTVVEKVITKEISAVKTLSETDLINSKGSQEVIAFISNKRIMLIDENPDGTDKKTLTYCFDVLTPDNKSLVLFVTKTVYEAYKVEDKLKVNYEIFTNDLGVEFPIVSVVTDIKG